MPGGCWVRPSGHSGQTFTFGPGNERITTGGGNDLIVYGEGNGRDEVLDFTPGSDIVQLNIGVGSNHIDNFQELQSLTKVTTGKNSVTVTFDNGDALTLTGVNTLNAADWTFVG